MGTLSVNLQGSRSSNYAITAMVQWSIDLTNMWYIRYILCKLVQLYDKAAMPIFHIMIFKHIFHKRESLFMLPKRKYVCMLKRKFCVASFRILTIIIVFPFMLFFFTLHLALIAFVSAQKIHFFPENQSQIFIFPSRFWKEWVADV